MILIAIASILAVSVLVLAGGALIAFAVQLISRFFDSSLPSAAMLAAFNTRPAAELTQKRLSKDMPAEKMEKVKRDAIEDDEADMEPLPASNGLFDMLGKYSRYIALLAAWTATCGSLFMSEVLGWVPCLLCWYQRIFMYPLSLILTVGILRRDKGLHKYVLMLSIPGACISVYHYLIQKVPGLEVIAPCRIGVPCTSDYINWLGFITIPFLALTAFLITTFMALASTLSTVDQDVTGEEDEGDAAENAAVMQGRRRAPVLPVVAIIIAVVLSFVVAGVVYSRSAPVAASGGNTSTPIVSATPDSAAAARGQALFQQNCTECHGANGEGALAGVKPLSQSNVLRNNPDEQVLAFLQAGRATNDPHNVSGIAMPARGGHASLTDANLSDLVAYMRILVK